MKGIIRSLRPEQWLKNGFVLAPIVFSGLVGNPDAWLRTVLAVAAFCAGTPHFSLKEFRRLASQVRGRQARQGVDVLISTSREISGLLKKAEWADALWTFGVKIIVDTCTYLTPIALSGDGIIVTNSAKWAHYAPGTINSRSALMSLDRCIRCAEEGKVVR